MKLSPVEFRILRKDLPAVNALLRLGMIAMKDGRLIVIDAGQSILDEHKQAVSLKRSKAGRLGGPARSKSLTPRRRKQIASDAGASSWPRKGGKS